jgi:hypothetical protein
MTGPIVPPEGAPPAHFADGWTDSDIKANPAVRKFESPEALARGYVELEGKIGQKGVILPQEGANLQEIRSAFTELGCPPTAAEYDLEGFKPPAGLPWDDAMMTTLQEKAWQMGLSQPQWREMLDTYASQQGGAQKNINEQLEAAAVEATQDLQTEWGASYPAQIAAAQAATTAIYGEADAISMVVDPQGKLLGNNPAFIKVMAKLGEQMVEANLIQGVPTRVTRSPDEARGELSKLMADTAFVKSLMDPLAADHDDCIKKRDGLYNLIAGTTPAEGALVSEGFVSTRT